MNSYDDFYKHIVSKMILIDFYIESSGSFEIEISTMNIEIDDKNVLRIGPFSKPFGLVDKHLFNEISPIYFLSLLLLLFLRNKDHMILFLQVVGLLKDYY